MVLCSKAEGHEMCWLLRKCTWAPIWHHPKVSKSNLDHTRGHLSSTWDPAPSETVLLVIHCSYLFPFSVPWCCSKTVFQDLSYSLSAYRKLFHNINVWDILWKEFQFHITKEREMPPLKKTQTKNKFTNQDCKILFISRSWVLYSIYTYLDDI